MASLAICGFVHVDRGWTSLAGHKRQPLESHPAKMSKCQFILLLIHRTNPCKARRSRQAGRWSQNNFDFHIGRESASGIAFAFSRIEVNLYLMSDQRFVYVFSHRVQYLCNILYRNLMCNSKLVIANFVFNGKTKFL